MTTKAKLSQIYSPGYKFNWVMLSDSLLGPDDEYTALVIASFLETARDLRIEDFVIVTGIAEEEVFVNGKTHDVTGGPFAAVVEKPGEMPAGVRVLFRATSVPNRGWYDATKADLLSGLK